MPNKGYRQTEEHRRRLSESNRKAHAPTEPYYLKEDRGYSTACWIWQRSLNAKGYPYFCRTVMGKVETKRAHRMYYEERHGPIPGNLTVDHLCRQRACVNPAHMEIVTLQENIRRRGRP